MTASTTAPMMPPVMPPAAETRDARFWDRLSARYARQPVADPAAYARTLERTRGYLHPRARVLELGCGSGSTALQLAGDVAEYIATDLSPEMIRIGARRLAESPVPGLSFEAGTVQDMAQEGPFDVVLGFNYLHLVRDLPGTLAVISKLLAPGGVFISKTPCLREMNPLIRGLVIPVMQAVGKAPHVASFSVDGLEDTLHDADFALELTENHAGKGDDHRPFVVARPW